MTQLIYVAGLGRSGSTILDIILGNHRDIKGCGQLSEAVGNAFINNSICSCGAHVRECEFWSKVSDLYLSGIGDDDFRPLAELQCELESYRNFFKLLRGGFPETMLRSYAERINCLADCIAEVSGKSIVLDSSKNPCRLLALSLCGAVDFSVIHLVRDGRGVTYSRMKKQRILSRGDEEAYSKVRPAWKTAVTWSVINLMTLIGLSVYRKRCGRKGVVLTYEDFVKNPGKTLDAVGEAAGVDFSEVYSSIMKSEPMEIDHRLESNKVSFSTTVKLKYDDEWKRKLSTMDKTIFLILAWPLHLYYKLISRKQQKRG